MTISQKVQSFFKEVWVEMKKVTWLTRGEIIQYTLIVLAATIFVAAFLGGLDYLFTTIVKWAVLNQF